METTVKVERIENDDAQSILPSDEIIQQNLKPKKEKRPARQGKFYKCRVCYKLFKTKEDLSDHDSTHDPYNPYACTLCPYKTDKRKSLSRHTRRVHDKHKHKEECHVCGKRFLFKCLLDQHMRVHTGEKPNKCEVCGKEFNSAYSLKTHKLIHTNEKPYKCAFCDHRCRDNSTLRKHQNFHLGIAKLYPCSECDKKFYTNARLKEHVNETHREDEYVRPVCTICGSNFKNKRNLSIHIRAVHEKSTTCKCGICGRQISNASNLAAHMTTHLDLRPFKCTYPGCTCKYKDKGTLKKHSRTHDPEQQVFCNDCGRGFTRKSRLIKHFAQHMPRVKNIECPFCKSSFFNKSYLLKHLRYKHGKRNKYICDMCGFESYNKPGLVVHLRHKHTTTDKQCHICRQRFKRKINLYKHYDTKHNITFKSDDCKPMVEIKQEPIEFTSELEIDLLEIEKEEPFAGFDINPAKPNDDPIPRTVAEIMKLTEDQSNCEINDEAKEINSEIKDIEKESQENIKNITTTEEELETSNVAEEIEDEVKDVNIEDLEKNTQENPENMSIVAEEKVTSDVVEEIEDKVEDVFRATDSKEDALQAESGQTNMEVDEIIHKMISEQEDKVDVSGATDSKEKSLQAESGQTTIEVDEIIHKMIAEQEDKAEGTECKDITPQVESGRRAMQVDEFLQHVMGDTDIHTDQEIDEESEEYWRAKIKELIARSDKKNGIRRKPTALGRKVIRLKENEISEYLLKNNNTKVNEEVRSQTEDERSVKKKKRKKHKRDKKRKEGQKDKIKNKDLGKVKGHIKVRFAKKSKNNYNEDSDDENETENDNNKESEGDSNIAKENNALKLIFNSHQCYVCYKLFQTKPELIEHCKQHFDVCSEKTLKKCPFCPFVTHNDIKRHMRLMHKQNLQYHFMRIKDKKNNGNGSRYYCETASDNVKELEIIPSVKILNKKACMEIDKRNRELKDKSLLTRKLVRKGNEWVVETEKIDVTEHVVPKLKDKSNYLAKMKELSIQSKKNKTKLLFPCNGCDKICQNLSALTLHMRRHDPNAKPFKPKKWKHKQLGSKEIPESNTILDTSNREAKPKPILTRHRCDPKLQAFFEKNIKGGDIEFWQFLKIFNKMDRENINDFKDLENRSDYGYHNTELNQNNATKSNNVDSNAESSKNNASSTESSRHNASSTESSKNIASSTDTNRINTSNINIYRNPNPSNTKICSKNVASKPDRIKKIKYVRKIQLSKEEYKRRCDLKNKLREKIAKTNNSL